MIYAGRPAPLGAEFDGDGVNFSVFAGDAERVELCMFDDAGREVRRHELPDCADGAWHGYLPGCSVGQRYGYRVHGPWNPGRGLRHNPTKLLIDPWARELAGTFRWSTAVYDFVPTEHDWVRNTEDSAACVPKSVVSAAGQASMPGRRIPWGEAIVYEANVRGYTMRHPGLDEAERGRFRGMSNGKILDYLKSLGITSIELMPVAEFIDEAFLVQRGLRNYWGYNTINFFAPAARYAYTDPAREFREMVDAIHDAGLEVLLDVAYNHTGESDTRGPSISFRGLDNLSYYRTVAGDPGNYVNDTGCGNTLDTEHARTRELILGSLRYWSCDMGVDGFRFDLATIMGRTKQQYTREHPLLVAISQDPQLQTVKLIAEPWDPGPGGYQSGNFPDCWAEWNDRYRDSARRYWRGDRGESAELARRLHGSADIFEGSGRGPWASVNFVTAHDGYTLLDLVSYEQRHNEANGENNLDGHAHNYSCNYGVEGLSNDETVMARRRRHRLNLLATLLLSEGTPMLLGGDEFGNSQSGNNNAYAQDNETGWLDWSGLDRDPDFTQAVRRLVRQRQCASLFSQARYAHGSELPGAPLRNIEWWRPDGRTMDAADWASDGGFCLVRAASTATGIEAIAVLLNPGRDVLEFVMRTEPSGYYWTLGYSTSSDTVRGTAASWLAGAYSVTCLRLHRAADG